MHIRNCYRRLSFAAAAFVAVAAVWQTPVQASDDEFEDEQQEVKAELNPCFSQTAQAYRLTAGDILRVSVWQEAELTRELKLRPDGAFYFPLAGELAAQGKTLEQLRQMLKTKLSKFVAEPEVSVSLVNTAKTVYIIGKVNRSTELPLDKPLTITQALAKAGGMTAFADSDDIQLVRNCQGQRHSFEFNYDKLSKGKALMADIALRQGYLVIVP